jgi:hypothetical protein
LGELLEKKMDWIVFLGELLEKKRKEKKRKYDL